MRIALIIERFAPRAGGVESVAWTVAHGLARAGDEVHVVARGATPSAEIKLHQVDVTTAWQPLRVSGFSRAAARAAPRGDFDIVYSLARTTHQDVYRAGGGSHASYMKRRYRGLSRTIRRVSPRHALLLALEERVFRDSTQVVQCNSEMVRRELVLRYGIPPERIVVVRNGVDLGRFDPENRDQLGAPLRRELGASAAPVWLFAGSGFRRKGLDTAMRALARAERSDSQLWIVGADRATQWRRLARSLGIEARIRLLGFRSDMHALYAAADALLLPTRYDACANVCLEAAAAGIPVVTSAANGAAEILDGAGFAIDEPEDVDGFASALDALSDKPTRQRMGGTARAAALTLSWGTHMTALRGLFAGLRP
jgi:UDP-glucose:(heptosyl)LPS alpha-1,3-glucosyltransferase